MNVPLHTRLGRWERLNDAILIAPKLLYVSTSTVYYAFYLFRANFAIDYLQLGQREYGDLTSLMALISFIFMTLWSTFADAVGRHRSILAFLGLALAGTFSLFLFQLEDSMVRFWVSAGILALYSFFACGITPLMDYQALSILGSKPGFSKDLYGRQRLWGTISYSVVSIFIGFLIDHVGLWTMFVFLPVAATIYAVLLFAFGTPDKPKPISQIFNSHEKTLNERGEKVVATSTFGGILTLLTNPNYMFMLLVVFMSGSARAIMTNFLSMFQQKSLGMTGKQTGYAATWGVVLEVGSFMIGPWLLQYLGIYWMFILAQLAMVARTWAYVFIPDNMENVCYVVYAIELLKGISFGLTQSAGVKLANEVAPKGLEATAQALYTSIYSQLPAVITAFAGGRIYSAHGGVYLFRITAIVSSAALVIVTIKYIADGSIRLFGARRKEGTVSGRP